MKRKNVTRTALVATASAVALVGVVAAAPPASAAVIRGCYQNERKFALPHKPDVTVRILLCAERAGSVVNAEASVYWYGSGGIIGGTRFNDFKITLNAERNDAVKATRTFTETGRLNDAYSNHVNLAVTASAPGRGGWSADGQVIVDINDDGAGDYIWALHGSSPLVD